MPIPQNKLELSTAIQDTYAKLKTDLESIPLSHTQKKELPGHAKDTLMSVENLVAYLIGWGELVLKWERKNAKGQAIDFPEKGFHWNELGLLAQKFYKDYEAFRYPALLKKLDQVVHKIFKLIEKTSEEVLYDTPFYNQYPLGRMIQLNTSSPYKNARARVRRYKVKVNSKT